ncbi:response regulator transcription factor [Stappia indica]|uniref:Two-component system, OmpR family, phosphate regulon response regulator OmpR n=1 Tax=Stappia indica TaxID=538381 RepID=A0A285R7L0_9HYPH|nr:response regulator transcription factor [Stappia indica]MCC4242878.1 response regulator transcription factor [Stappia indica]SOB90093.1 two-component system, OmpR family, phosphate regulon response regulator OmpR [Stappia indica]
MTTDSIETQAAAPPPAASVQDDAPHLLLVDDDTRIRTLLKRFLTEHGFRITVAASAAEARRRMNGLAFDLLVVDVMMPGESGLELAADLHARSDVPILMLTARSDAADRIAGLEAGADDYLVKPFEPRELLLRIRAILRRRATAEVPEPTDIRFGPYVFDAARRELRRGDEVIRLTDREKEILTLFTEKPNETVPRTEIVGDDSGLGERTVDVQINRLRRKIETDPGNPLYLQTVRGIGYRLVCD